MLTVEKRRRTRRRAKVRRKNGAGPPSLRPAGQAKAKGKEPRLAFKRAAFSEQPDACETRSPCFLDHTALDAILLANIAHNCEIRATLE